MTSREYSLRHHRRKRLLIYRPSPGSPKSSQYCAGAWADEDSPRGLPRTLHLASPMERERRRVLSVELRDIGHEVEQLQVKTPCERTSRADDWTTCQRLNSTSHCKDLVNTKPVPIVPSSTEEPSCQPTLMPPKEEPGWGLVPLFNSVRSKLESFAEIFLTPVKSLRDARNSENSASSGNRSQPDSLVSKGTVQPFTRSSEHLRVDPEDCCLNEHSSAALHGDGTTHSHLLRTPPSIRPQNETSPTPSILCRPPLQRHLSCPLTQHKRRHSLDKIENATESCTFGRRRHSLGSVEECRNLTPLFLSCLRKENHPSVLRQSLYQPGDLQKSANGSIHSEGAPVSLCLDKDSEQCLKAVEEQITKESLPDSDFKSPESLFRFKENKVSNIQIRKRALRQEGKLTPLGLPKRVRLHKEDFSLEEIYTNKNYHTPTEKRKFETIFEEPVMKGGTLVLTSQRPLRRVMVFKDGGSAPRKRKKKKKRKGTGRSRRYAAANSEEHVNYELLLQHKLSQLEVELQEDLSEP